MKKFLLITWLFTTISFIGCDKPRIVVENDTEGFDVVKVFGSDTICRISWEGHTAIIDSTGEPREGRFFDYHKDDTIFTRFICCDRTYGGKIVDGHIDEFIFDSVFLLADQKPVDSILGKYIRIYLDDEDSSNYYLRRQYDTCRNYTDKMSMLHISHIHQYWIINKTSLDVYGPFSYDEYLHMKKQLGVPPTLMLKKEKYSK